MPDYVHTIYLARHPVSVMRSFHAYRMALDDATPGFEAFCNDAHHGISAWRKHVRSWLMSKGDSNARFAYLVRYEDLLADAAGIIGQMSDSFGWGLEDRSVRKAVSLSSRKKMRGQEHHYRERNPNHLMHFVGSAERECSLIDHMDRHISSVCQEEIAMLGYPLPTN